MKSIFKEFIATFKRFKVVATLNIIGLSIAIASFMGILFLVHFENSFEKFRPNTDQIFRVETWRPEDQKYSATTTISLGNVLKQNCPDIKNYFFIQAGAEIHSFVPEKANSSNDKFQEYLYTATPSIIDILSFKIIEGEKEKILAPNTLLLPRSLAQKWFGSSSAIGQPIKIDNNRIYTITSVYEDFPANSFFKNYCYASLKERIDNWTNWGPQLYIQTSEKNRQRLQEKLNNINIPPLENALNYSKTKDSHPLLRLTNLRDIYYDNSSSYDYFDKGNQTTVIFLFITAILIIAISAINFVNFNMSLTPTRIRKINIHKILGQKISILKINIICENTIYWFCSFLCALLLLLFIPLNNLIPISISPFNNIYLVGISAIIILCLGILTGLYPSWYATSFSPSLMLKGNFVLTPKGVKIRNGLLAFQFTTSIILIIITLTLYIQSHFIQNYKLGFQTENIVCLEMNSPLIEQKEAFVNELKSIPEIIDCTFSDWAPEDDITLTNGNLNIGEQTIRLNIMFVDKNFMNFFNIQTIEGDSFTRNYEIMFNEIATKQFPFLKNHLGKIIPNLGKITGFSKDMNYWSLKKPIEPLAFLYFEPHDYYYMYAKLTGNNINKSIAHIKTIFNKFTPNNMFNIQFVDQFLQKRYEKEQQLIRTSTLLGIIAITLALSGVYSLVFFNTQFRRKEIAIRKINGATEKEVLLWLNKSFIQLVIITFCIATPIAYWLCHQWLENFIYKTEIYWWIFLIAGLTVLFVVIFIVSLQSWKGATENPVESLKSE